MIRIHYNPILNDRKEVARRFGEKMLLIPAYDKHTKSYIVGKVRFLRHGMIEGWFNGEEIEALIDILKNWSFVDKESSQEYEKMSAGIDTYQISETNISTEEGVVNKTTEALMSIEVSKEGITEEAEAALLKLIDVHYDLIKKALGASMLPLVYTDDTISFPWFKPPIDECERVAYSDFITHLVDKAKSTKYIYEPAMG
jgi:hypothetical protein